MLESFYGVGTYDQFVNAEYGNVEANAGKWRADAGTSAAFSLDAGGPRGDLCLRKLTSTNANVRCRTIPGAVTEVIVGFRFKPGTLGATADGFFALYDQAGTVIFRLNHINATIQVQYGTASSIATVFTTGSVLSVSRWDYIEVRYKMADASAVTEVRMNGQVLYTATTDNKLTASTSIAYVGLGVVGSTTTGGIDDRWADLYINDASGSNNTYWGDTKVKVARPNASGNSSQFVNSAATSTNNYSYIDEQSRDPADYVESSADGDKDTYAYSNISAQGVIGAVQLVVQGAALNGGDPKDFNGIARLSTTEITALLDLTTVMREAFCTFETKPGGGAWTTTDVNNAEFGQSQLDA